MTRSRSGVGDADLTYSGEKYGHTVLPFLNPGSTLSLILPFSQENRTYLVSTYVGVGTRDTRPKSINLRIGVMRCSSSPKFGMKLPNITKDL